jgi:hypothetical protein
MRLAREAIALCDEAGLLVAAAYLQHGHDLIPGVAQRVRQDRLPWGLDEPLIAHADDDAARDN